MTIEKPPLPNAEPGRPITAQGWNGIVDAVSKLYDAVNAIGSGLLEVDVTSDGRPITAATVTAVPDGPGNPIAAVAPMADRTTFRIAGVSDGQWTVTAAATGFTTKSVTVSVPSASPVLIELAPVGPVVPNLFGVPFQTAFAALTSASLGVGAIVDTFGKEVPRSPIPTQYQNTPVLFQLPPAGTRLDPTERVNLVVAATVTQAPVVTMPNLSGLTQDEAVRVLEQLGLSIGRIQVVST